MYQYDYIYLPCKVWRSEYNIRKILLAFMLDKQFTQLCTKIAVTIDLLDGFI